MNGDSKSIEPELNIVREFIRDCIPFDQLHPEQLSQVVRAIEVEYYRSGQVFKSDQADIGGLRIIRSGAAELRSADGQLIDRFGDRVCFNLLGLSKEHPGISANLIEDSLIYLLPESSYQAIRSEHRDFDRFFHSQRSRRIRRAARSHSNPRDMLFILKDVMSTDLITVTPSHSIQQAAQLMSERRVSSVMVMEADQLVGLVTDRDIRSRAVAQGLDYSLPITSISSSEPISISPDKTLFDTVLCMTRHGIHHLPVMEANQVVGFVTSSDLMLARKDDPVYLVQHIGRQKSLATLRKTVSQLPDLMVQWTHAGMRAAQVASLFTAISDAVTGRLIELYIEDKGSPPVPFAWLGFGSQGRAEQLLGGDQDNAMLIDDSLQAGQAMWYEDLANWVCDGLNECGWVYCPGDIMASNAQWRQTLAGWQVTVNKWAQTPTPKATMLVSIFFDIRVVYGDQTLGLKLQHHMLEKGSANKIFLAALAENALEHKPPLGIFRQFVVEHDGEHEDELDLKKRGLLPIIETARIHSLAAKIAAVNTIERLDALAKAKVLTINESRNLQDALRIIMQVRLREQVNELTQAQAPNNYINPDNLSKLEREQLRDAFSVIRDAQKGIQMRYRPGV